MNKSTIFKRQYSLSEHDFSRERIFTFPLVMITILNNISKSLGVKIWDILNQITICSHLGRYDEAEIMLFRPTWQSAQSLLKQACDNTLLLLGDIAIGLIKDEIPKVLFGNMSIQTLSSRLIPSILKYRIPVRPNRSFERKRKHKLKFSMNLRRCV